MRTEENQGFICVNCKREVLPLSNGSYRNHCPYCLYSLHVDQKIGDRAATCKGQMRPVAYRYHNKKGWQILHRCQRCKKEQWNVIARDTVQEDLFIEWIESLE